MDLAFTPEEQKFREEVRAWVRANLPQEIAHSIFRLCDLRRNQAGVERRTMKQAVVADQRVVEVDADAHVSPDVS